MVICGSFMLQINISKDISLNSRRSPPETEVFFSLSLFFSFLSSKDMDNQILKIVFSLVADKVRLGWSDEEHFELHD